MLSALTFAAIAAAADVAGSLVVLRAHRGGHGSLRYFVAAGAGFMLAAAFVRMLPEGFTVASSTLASGRSRVAALLAGTALGVLTLLRAVATTLLAGRHIGYALALSAGVTIYVAASDLIPEVNREGGPALAWTVFGGLVLVTCADWALSHFGLE